MNSSCDRRHAFSLHRYIVINVHVKLVERLLAHLSQRLTGELIGCEGIRRLSSTSVHNFKEVSGPILIKFNVNHHLAGELTALGLGADCIKIVVSMATNSSHRLTMGKTKKYDSLIPEGTQLFIF